MSKLELRRYSEVEWKGGHGEMGVQQIFWSKARPAYKADNLTAMCERIV
jgi:hypothetical protein